VEVIRFGAELGRPVTQFGSDLRLATLTAGDARVRLVVLHLPPGGRVGRHPAVARQLFAVVAGRGWVTGGDGVRRAIGPGYGAVWEPGEDHDAEADADTGLTAVCAEGRFDLDAIRLTQDIVVVDYDPRWPEWFATVQRHVWPAVEDVALRVDHVGSTSVPGLAAKPIIDLDIVVASADLVPVAIERLAGIGYRWRGDLGVPGREAFTPEPGVADAADAADAVGAAADAGDLPRHHLYLVVENNDAHLDHWLLRDLLRDDADARRRYAEIKRHSAGLAGGDIEAYGTTKSPLIAELLARARAAWPGPGVGRRGDVRS
jgi:GrpB-like predicted nucleotidyltransferase (UPF0157 family)/quercetin dioxygenase-like cupin family protein